jgi:hypothetical protein
MIVGGGGVNRVRAGLGYGLMRSCTPARLHGHAEGYPSRLLTLRSQGSCAAAARSRAEGRRP